jgi:hypothetical protein
MMEGRPRLTLAFGGMGEHWWLHLASRLRTRYPRVSQAKMDIDKRTAGRWQRAARRAGWRVVGFREETSCEGRSRGGRKLRFASRHPWHYYYCTLRCIDCTVPYLMFRYIWQAGSIRKSPNMYLALDLLNGLK